MTKMRRTFKGRVQARGGGALLESSGRLLMQVAALLGIQPSMLRSWRPGMHGTTLPKLVSRELGVPVADLSAWREAFLAAGEASLKARPADGRDLETGRLKAKVGDLTMTRELLEAKIERLERGRPPITSGAGSLAPRRSRR